MSLSGWIMYPGEEHSATNRETAREWLATLPVGVRMPLLVDWFERGFLSKGDARALADGLTGGASANR